MLISGYFQEEKRNNCINIHLGVSIIFEKNTLHESVFMIMEKGGLPADYNNYVFIIPTLGLDLSDSPKT